MRTVKPLTFVKKAAIVCLLFPLGVNAQNWPMVNGCKERTSWAEGENVLLPPLQKSMEYPLGGRYASRISFYDNMLYVSDAADTSKVVAFNAQDGSEHWQFTIPNARASVGFVPTIYDSLLLCGGQHGLGLYALDRFTGEEVWFKGIGSLNYRSPTIDSNRVYIVGEDSLYCLDARNGKTIWSYSFSEPASPIVDEEKVYICGDRKLIALNKMNGDSVWQIYNSQRFYSALTIDDKYVYTYNNDSIIALDKVGAGLEWAYKIPDGEFPQSSINAIAISDSFLCFSIQEDSNNQGQIYTLDKKKGDYLWNYSFDTVGAYCPAIANGIVYTVNWASYSVWGFDLGTGQKVFSDSSEKYLGQPVIADGKLFVEAYGKVVAFENYGTGIIPAKTVGQNFPEVIPSWPNPFKQSTRFEFHLDQSEDLNISVYDLSGKRVKTISNKLYEAGAYILTWDGTNERGQKVPEGIYILKLISKNYIRSGRMILLE